MTNEFAFTDTSEKLSTTLEKLIGKLQGQTITLRELMEAIGEQGLLLICAIASLPFLIPVSIPGVSTVFGAAIILVSLAITLNRLPWLPAKILDRQMEAAKACSRPSKRRRHCLQARWFHPSAHSHADDGHHRQPDKRACADDGGRIADDAARLHSLLQHPSGRRDPAFSAGMIQRDGVTVLGGYLFLGLTTIYFAALAYAAFWAGQGISSSIGA